MSSISGISVPTRLSFYCDRVIQWCTIAIVVVVPLLFVDEMNSFVMPKTMVFRSLVEIMAVAWMIRSREDRDWRWSRDALSIAVVVYGCIGLMATATSIDPFVSFWGSYDRMEGFVTIAHLIIFFMIVRASLYGDQLRRIVRWMVGASTVVSLVAIAQHFQLDPTRYTIPVQQRVIGTLENPLTLGAYLVMLLPWSVWLVRCSVTMKEGLFAFVSMVLQVVALVFTSNRSSSLALVGSLTFMGFCWCAGLRRWKLALVPLLSAALMIGAGVYAARTGITTSQVAVNRFISIFALEDASATNRLLLWSMASRAMREHPGLGYGPEQARWALARTYDPRLARSQYVHYDRAHNQWLDIGIGQGYSGVIAFAVIVILMYSMGMFLLFKTNGDDFQRWTLLVLLATITAYCIQNFFYFDTITTAVFFWFFTAVMSNQNKPICEPKGSQRKRSHPRVYWIMGIVGGLVMITINIVPWVQDVVYSSALKTQDMQKVAAARENAVWWNPLAYMYYDHFGRLLVDAAVQLGDSGNTALAVEWFGRAQLELDSAIRQNPYYIPSLDVKNYLYTAWSAVDRSKFSIAEKGYRDMIRVSPGRVVIYWDLGYLYVQMKKNEQALEAVNTAIALDPGNGGSYHKLYVVYEQFGQKDNPEAQRALERAKALGYANQ